jgi:hypothetical protein
MEVVTLKRSISNLLVETFILPPCIKALFSNRPAKTSAEPMAS